MHYMFTDYLQHKTYENLQKLLHDYETLAKAQLLIWQRLRREALVGITPQQKEIGTMHSANPSLCRTQTEAEGRERREATSLAGPKSIDN